MLSINTNLSSLIAQGSMKSSTNKLNQAIERMTTGFKINHAKDNAANYSIATNMTTKIGAYNVAEDNAAMGLDLISTAEGTLSQIEDKLQRLRALAEQASNGTYGEQSLNAINAEANALVDEINRLYSTAEYNGIKLFDQETQVPDDPNIPKAQYDGFIKEVVKRDTSTMTALASVDGSADLADGTYSISTPEEMKKLADMTNAGLVSAGDEFVLANDIDLSQYENWTPIGKRDFVNGLYEGYAFLGILDGNGFTVSNLFINVTPSDERHQSGLIAYANGATIKNIKMYNVNIQNSNFHTGALVGICYYTTIDKVSVSNMLGNMKNVPCGGIVGCLNSGSLLQNSVAKDVSIAATEYSGGLVGDFARAMISDCIVEDFCTVAKKAAGIAAKAFGTGNVVKGCYVNGGVSGLYGLIIGQFESDSTDVSVEDCYISSKHKAMGLAGLNEQGIINESNTTYVDDITSQRINFQVGTNSDKNSQINFNMDFLSKTFNVYRGIGLIETVFLESIDNVLVSLSDSQTKLGATSNRLESVLEEITIQRDNLVSSRSTIRDADIADVSSTYIQQQILQQASATLLATANQSPAIALQLI